MNSREAPEKSLPKRGSLWKAVGRSDVVRYPLWQHSTDRKNVLTTKESSIHVRHGAGIYVEIDAQGRGIFDAGT